MSICFHSSILKKVSVGALIIILWGYSFTKGFLWMTSQKKENSFERTLCWSTFLYIFDGLALTLSYGFWCIWLRRDDTSLDTLKAVWGKWLRRHDTYLALWLSVMKMKFDAAIRVWQSELSSPPKLVPAPTTFSLGLSSSC